MCDVGAGEAVAGAAAAAAAIYTADKEADSRKDALNWSKDQYYQGAEKMGQAGAIGAGLWQEGINQLYDAQRTADAQSKMFQDESKDYKIRADEAQKKMQGYYDDMLGNFQDMLGENEEDLQNFNRRYGNIMDNVKEGIMDVSAQQLAAGGREQLSLDMETLGKTFDNSMASRGLARSGMSVEADRRMAMDTAQQARAIDVNSNAQAMQLQGQGIQNLNSMNNIGQGIRNQGMEIMGQQGQAMQGIGSTYGNMANNFYNVSNSMFGKGFNNSLNARTNIGSAYNSLGASRIGSHDSFYSGVAQTGNAGVINSYNSQANAYGADAAGFASTAGNMFAKSFNAFNQPNTGTPIPQDYQDHANNNNLV